MTDGVELPAQLNPGEQHEGAQQQYQAVLTWHWGRDSSQRMVAFKYCQEQ